MSNNIPDYKNNLYFNSQNTKNEQQKDLCIISEQLTEQMKKGELSIGWYYTKLWKECIVIDYFIGNQFLKYDNSDIVEVIAPVPSYEEWQDLKSRLQLKETAYDFDTARLEAENIQLKELLKEIKGKLHYINTPKNQHNVFSNDFMKKLDEALK